MKKQHLLIIFLIILSTNIYGARWSVFSNCDSGDAVLDINQFNQYEFQFVIRSPRIIDYLVKTDVNQRNNVGEIVIPLHRQSENIWSKHHHRHFEYILERNYEFMHYKVFRGIISQQGKWIRQELLADWQFYSCH